MKNTITITDQNINLFSPYQANDQRLAVGDIVTLEINKVPCVTHRKGSGLALTFSIYSGRVLSDTKSPVPEFWQYNRYAINDKHTK